MTSSESSVLTVQQWIPCSVCGLIWWISHEEMRGEGPPIHFRTEGMNLFPFYAQCANCLIRFGSVHPTLFPRLLALLLWNVVWIFMVSRWWFMHILVTPWPFPLFPINLSPLSNTPSHDDMRNNKKHDFLAVCCRYSGSPEYFMIC